MNEFQRPFRIVFFFVVVGWLCLLLGLYGVDWFGRKPEDWFARSGAFGVAASLVASQALQFIASLYDATAMWGGGLEKTEGRREIAAKVRRLVSVMGYVVLTLGIVSTFVWGFGDIARVYFVKVFLGT